MRIATLQFSPRVGEIEANVEQADSLLSAAELQGRLDCLDLLVLPEMAFTGYNFSSFAEISPWLEPTAAGISTSWAIRTAQRLGCIVAVGYPELSNSATPISCSIASDEEEAPVNGTGKHTAYNSLVLVDTLGSVIGHHRKAFLYYTDDTWAKEGPDGFFCGDLPLSAGRTNVKVAAGICMDINPYKFESPYTAYEFANHCRETTAKVVILSMAWLMARPNAEAYEENIKITEKVKELPDMDTISYWIGRFAPLSEVNGSEDEVIIVFANRAGEEGEAPLIGKVRYAGSSGVMAIRKASEGEETNIRIWDVMGQGSNGILVVDTTEQARYRVRSRPPEPEKHESAAEEPSPEV